MTEAFDRRFDDERNEKQESDSGDERKRKKARPNKSPNSGRVLLSRPK